MYFRVNLKLKKPTLCCLTWIVFIELIFTNRKLGMDNLLVKWERMGILRNRRDPSNGIGRRRFYFEKSFRAFLALELLSDISTKVSTFSVFAF